ncbi:AzlC family ABC transporter permease [Angustibacter sp. McL0619]|uniref:AzlC family ABC transporter permease n=1 Tax=Angustibacter sp. McL0619 TaxID=3415676 RepID=UPI003CF3E98A
MTAPPDALPQARRRAVLRQSVAVGVATGLYGISFGALSVAAGIGFWPTVALSALLFTGGSQFAFVGVVAAGGGPAAAVATSTMLGVRNGLYGMQVAQWLHAHGPRRLAAAQLTIDESFAVGSGQPEPAARTLGFWVTGAAVYVGWNLMTALGALIGDRLGDPRRYGLDAMAAAAFVALLWPRLTSREPRVVAVMAAALALVCVPVLPAGLPILAAGLVAVAAAVWQHQRSPTAHRGTS